MKYKWRKKYTEADAKWQIESINMSIGNYSEEIMYASTRWIDPLILALCHKTNEECIDDAEKQIEYLFSKKQYLTQFLCNT
jgi:hypothetical protein